MNHNMEKLTPPIPAHPVNGSHSPGAFPSNISALRCCFRRFTPNADPPNECRLPPAHAVWPMIPDAG